MLQLIQTVAWTAGDIDRHVKNCGNVTFTHAVGIRCNQDRFTFEVLTSQYILVVRV